MVVKICVFSLLLLTFISSNPASGESDLVAPLRDSLDISPDNGFFYRNKREAPGNDTNFIEAIKSELLIRVTDNIPSIAQTLQVQINSNLDQLTSLLTTHYSFETSEDPILASIISIKNVYVQKLFEILSLVKVRSSRFLNQIVAEAQLRAADDGNNQLVDGGLLGNLFDTVFGLVDDLTGNLLTNLLGNLGNLTTTLLGDLLKSLGLGNLLGQVQNLVTALLTVVTVNLGLPVILGLVVQILNSTTGLGGLITNNLVGTVVLTLSTVLSVGAVSYLVNAVKQIVSGILGL